MVEYSGHTTDPIKGNIVTRTSGNVSASTPYRRRNRSYTSFHVSFSVENLVLLDALNSLLIYLNKSRALRAYQPIRPSEFQNNTVLRDACIKELQYGDGIFLEGRLSGRLIQLLVTTREFIDDQVSTLCIELDRNDLYEPTAMLHELQTTTDYAEKEY